MKIASNISLPLPAKLEFSDRDENFVSADVPSLIFELPVSEQISIEQETIAKIESFSSGKAALSESEDTEPKELDPHIVSPKVIIEPRKSLDQNFHGYYLNNDNHRSDLVQDNLSVSELKPSSVGQVSGVKSDDVKLMGVDNHSKKSELGFEQGGLQRNRLHFDNRARQKFAPAGLGQPGEITSFNITQILGVFTSQETVIDYNLDSPNAIRIGNSLDINPNRSDLSLDIVDDGFGNIAHPDFERSVAGRTDQLTNRMIRDNNFQPLSGTSIPSEYDPQKNEFDVVSKNRNFERFTTKEIFVNGANVIPTVNSNIVATPLTYQMPESFTPAGSIFTTHHNDLPSIDKSTIGRQELVTNIARDLTSLFGGDARLQFRVTPENLGRLMVEIGHNDADVDVHFSVDQDSTHSLLSTAQTKLEAELRPLGYRVGRLDVLTTENGSQSYESHHGERLGQPNSRDKSWTTSSTDETVDLDISRPLSAVPLNSVRYA